MNFHSRLLIIGLALGTAPFASATKKGRAPASNPTMSEACYAPTTVEAARGIVAMELQSSLNASFKNFLGRAANTYGPSRLELPQKENGQIDHAAAIKKIVEDQKEWTYVLLGSEDSYSFNENGDSTNTVCSYVFFIPVEYSFRRGGGTGGLGMTYMVQSEVRRVESDSSDGRWTAEANTPQRVQFKTYKNGNPRG